MGTRGSRAPRGGTMKHKLPVFTEQSIQKVLNAQYMPQAKYILNNLFIYDWESDFIARTKSGYWYEVEIKVTVADFKNDFKHKVGKYRALTSGQALRPNYFSYAVPDEMVDKIKDLVRWAGIVSISANGFLTHVKMPEMLHHEKYSDDLLRLTDKFYYGFISYKDKYNNFTKELAKYRAEINSLKAEFKAVTGQTYKSYLQDSL